MARSIFSFLGRKSKISSTVLLLGLDPENDGKSGKSDDHSEINLKTTEYISPNLRILSGSVPQIPIIGVGGAGLRITNKIVLRLQSYGVEYNTLGIDINKEELDKNNLLKYRLLMTSGSKGTGKQYLRGQAIAKNNSDKIKESINEYLSSMDLEHNNEVVFLMLGSGGIGVGVTLELIDILITMGKRPVPFLVLPSENENTRIKFNASVALYNFSYAPFDRCKNLVTVCIDNDLFMHNNSNKSIAATIESINERVGSTIADIIISTELPSDGYSSDLNEFIEIFRQIKGIACLTYLHNINDDNINEFYKNNSSLSHSIACDIYSGTRSYLYIQSGKKQLTTMEYRSLLNNFNNIDIFPKLYEFGDEKYAEIRGITTGIKIPERIQTLMLFAEDVRVDLLNKEISSSESGKGNPKIDRLEGDSDIDVKDANELQNVRAEEYAKLRRGGDLT